MQFIDILQVVPTVADNILRMDRDKTLAEKSRGGVLLLGLSHNMTLLELMCCAVYSTR